MEVVGGVEGFVAGGFEGGDGGVEFAGGDLFGGGVGVAEFAGGEVGFAVVSGGAHGWAEGAAEDGAGCVEVAGAGGGVEDGAGLVVGELFEEDGGFVVFGEDAGGEIAGEPGVEAGEGLLDAGVDACGFLGVGVFEGGEAFTETGCVFVGDGEDSDAALVAAGAAGEVGAAAGDGGGEGGGYDLDEGLRHDELVNKFYWKSSCPKGCEKSGFRSPSGSFDLAQGMAVTNTWSRGMQKRCGRSDAIRHRVILRSHLPICCRRHSK